MSNAVDFLIALRPHQFYALVRKHRVWFTPMQASVYLQASTRTLESWRAAGKGPVYRGKGKNIRYHIADLDDYLHRPEELANG